jgi:hypothetical protein
MYGGDELKLPKYPHLKHIIQTGFTKMRGVSMFKDVAVYANPALTNVSIPVNSSDDLTHTYLKDGRETQTYTSGEAVREADSLWNDHLEPSAENREHPIFFASDFEKPFGFLTFMACSTHLKKLFSPGTFNVSKMIKSVPRQGSSFLVCDSELYNLEVPPQKTQEYQEMCSKVTHVLVSGKDQGRSSLFHNAKVAHLDPYQL